MDRLMKKLNVNMEYCHGIKKLEYEFDFETTGTYAIYAPNGVMKTSFANTFKDICTDKEPKDYIQPGRDSKRDIKKDNGNALTKEEVFVIESYNKDYNAEDKITTLMANKELKKKYDDIHININKEKEVFLSEIKGLAGKRIEIEKEVSEAFTHSPGEFYDSLVMAEKKVMSEEEPTYADISYAEIFNDKVLSVISEEGIRGKILDYINKYNELIDNSKYFKKGIFNHNNALDIAKSLNSNKFFDADHTVNMVNSQDGKKTEIKSKKELEILVNEEKDAILKGPVLTGAFEEIDKILSDTKGLQAFRDYLQANEKIIPALNNINRFKQDIWVSYFKEKKEFYIRMLEVYKKGEKEIKGIIEEARKEEPRWKEVIDKYNRRFFVPFKLRIKNKHDVVLKDDVASIEFDFVEAGKVIKESIKKEDLLEVLSSGERRAFYILNIIYEVEARKENNHKTLFIIDDISDSFDYKNKYAIIEYLKEISQDERFYQIILTHNFDFFRAIEGKVVKYDKCLIAEKTDEGIIIKDAEYIKNPFKKDWMKNLSDDYKLIASIPFVRNIIEYTKGEKDNYLELTKILHLKKDSCYITREKLKEIYNNEFPGVSNTILKDKKIIIELIYELAGKSLEATECINLEHKIVLSIAIRLKAEEYIKKVINNDEEVEKIDKNQFNRLYEMLLEKLGKDDNNVKTMEKVMLMTPENIHLNAFMYEPILDMSDEHLRRLYKEVCSL